MNKRPPEKVNAVLFSISFTLLFAEFKGMSEIPIPTVGCICHESFCVLVILNLKPTFNPKLMFGS